MSQGHPAGRPRSYFHWSLVAAVAVVVVDQVTKSLAVSRLGPEPVHVVWTLRLNLSFNSGLAFSQGRGLTSLITVAVIVLIGVLVVVARRSRGLPTAVAFGLLLGGAAGNLADRLLRDHGGAVVDFLDLQWWPVFNLADVAITVGAAMLVLGGLRGGGAGQAAPAAPGPAARAGR